MSSVSPNPLDSARCERPIGKPGRQRPARWVGVCLAGLWLALFAGVWPAGAADDALTPRRLYVPAANLDALVHRDDGGVVLSREEFETLLKEARAALVQGRPSAAVLSTADYTARIEGDQLVLTITVRGENFTNEWVTLPVRVGSLGIESATVGDEAAVISRGDPPEVLQWLLKETGSATLTLEASLPLAAVGSDRVAAFDLAGAPAGELRITLPAGKHLQYGGVSVRRPEEEEAPAEYVLAVGGQANVELRITDRAAESRADALTFASTAHGLLVAPGEVTWSARSSLHVIGRKIDRLVARVPRGLEITAVESPGLESWELADAAEGEFTTITLLWRQGFDGTRTLTFRGVVSQPDDGTWTAPTLQFDEITSHTGVLEVQYPAGVRVQPRVVEGARASTGGPAGEGLARPAPADGSSRLRFDLWEEDFTLTFSTEAKARELHVAMTNLLDVTDEGLMLFTLIEPSPLFDALFELQVVLPAEWEVQELEVAGETVAWRSVPLAAGVNELRVPLDPPLPPGESRSVRLVSRRLLENWPVESTPARFALPEVKLPQAGVVEALYGITGEEDVELTPVEITGLDPARRGDLETLERQLEGSGRTLKLGYAYQDTVFSGQLEAVRQPTRISAATLSFVQIDPETITTHLETQVRVTGGGAKELQVSLPEAAGADLQFALNTVYALRAWQEQKVIFLGPRIVEQQSTVENGRRVWTLKLDRRLYGDAVISTSVRQPRTEATEITPLVLDVVGAERQNGQIAVIAGDDQRVTLTARDAAGRPLPLVDPVDFPASFTFPVQALRSGRQRIVASVQYLQPGYTVSVGEQRFERTAVPTAVCRSARYETVIGGTGELQHEATLKLVAVGVQSLAVRLPEGNELWATLVDGTPVEVRRAGETLTLPLPAVEPADRERTIRLLYRGEAGTLAASGSLRQTPPRVAVVTGQGEEQPLEVLEQTWVVHHSPDTLLLESDGRFHTNRPLYSGTLLGRLGSLWSLPTPREATQMLLLAPLLLLLVVLTAVVRNRFGWVPAAGLVLMGLVTFFLMLPKVQQAEGIALGGGGMDLPAASYLTDDVPFAPASEAAPPATAAPTAPPVNEPVSGAAPTAAPLRRSTAQPAEGESSTFSFAIPAPEPDAPQLPSVQSRFNAQPRENWPDRSVNGMASPSDFAPPPPSPAPNADIPFRHGSFADPFGVSARQSHSLSLQIAQQQAVSPQSEDEQRRLGEIPYRQGARLSLALALAPPENFVSREFRYAGAETDPAAVDLDIAYADRRGSQMLLAAIAGGVLLGAWWLRRASPATRGTFAVATVAAPLALASLAPAVWLPLLDGVLVGGLLGLVLWLVLSICRCVSGCIDRTGCTTDVAPPSPSGGVSAAVPSPPPAVLLLAALSSLMFAGGSLAAEEKAPPPEPEAGRPVVIIPYEVGTDPLTAEQVLVPRDYFLKLWKAAHPEEQPGAKPPQPGVVAGALYRAELEPGEGTERTVRVEARLVLRQLGEESARLTLPLEPVAIESATLDDAPATLATSDDGKALTLVLTQPGLHVLDLVFRVPALNVTADSGRFTLPLRATPAGQLSFLVPAGDGTEVRLNGATDAYRLTSVDGHRVLEAPVAAGGNLTVAWRPKAARGAGEGTVQVESTIGATIDDAGLTVRHRFRYVVSQGTLSDVRFAIPADVSLKRIAGADVAGWEQSDEAEGRVLKVFLRRDVDDSTSLDLDLFRKLSLTETAGTVSVPTLHPQAVTRERGDVAVFAEPQLAVQAGTTSGLRQVNVANFTMDPALTQPGATARFAYRFDGRPFELPVSLSRRQPETRVTSEHGAQVLLRKVRIASRLVFDLREAPRANLSFALPAGYLALDVQGDYLVDWSVSEIEGGRVLTVELDQPRTGRVQVLLEGTQPRDPAMNTVSLHVPRPLGVNRQESQLGVWIDDTFTATVGEAGDWRSLDPSQLAESIRKLRGDAPQFGFRSTQPAPGAAAVALQRATADLSADAVILAAISDAALDYGLNLRWRIDRAAVDTFVVTTPDWMGEQVEFTGEGIRQIQSTARAEGGRTWTVTLHEPVTGQYLLSALATLPLPADDVARVPEIRFLTADGAAELALQRRFLVLVNVSSVHRLVEGAGASVERAQRDQLPLQLPAGLLDQAVEIAALPVGRALPSWTLESTAANQEAAATVLLADLRTVLAHDGSWRTQADYRVRNRGRQFLAIIPPVDARLLSVLVRDLPSQATRQEVEGQSMLLVPLPATSAVDLSFPIRLVFAGRLPRGLPSGFSLTGREIALPAPQVVSTSRSREYGLPVLQTLWRVDLPDDVLARRVDTSGKSNLTPGDVAAQGQAYEKTFLEDLKALVSLSSVREAARKSQTQDHLHNLGIALQNVQSHPDSRRTHTEVSRERQELLEQANKQLEQLQREVESLDPVAGKDSLHRNDFGRNFIADNNRDVLSLNGLVVDAHPEADVDTVLNFSVQQKLEQADAKKQAAEQPASRSRAMVREQLQDQELSYFNFDDVRSGSGIGGSGMGGMGGFGGGGFAAPAGGPRGSGRYQIVRPGQTVDGVRLLGRDPVEVSQVLGEIQGRTSTFTTASGEWTEAGGLSLTMDLPRSGQELTFTGLGGEPRLTLSVRPRETLATGLGLLWAVVCLGGAIALVRVMQHGGLVCKRALITLALVGFVAAVLLPSPLRYLGFVICVGAISGLLLRRASRTA